MTTGDEIGIKLIAGSGPGKPSPVSPAGGGAPFPPHMKRMHGELAVK
jgi:hypothetical protein